MHLIDILDEVVLIRERLPQYGEEALEVRTLDGADMRRTYIEDHDPHRIGRIGDGHALDTEVFVRTSHCELQLRTRRRGSAGLIVLAHEVVHGTDEVAALSLGHVVVPCRARAGRHDDQRNQKHCDAEHLDQVVEPVERDDRPGDHRNDRAELPEALLMTKLLELRRRKRRAGEVVGGGVVVEVRGHLRTPFISSPAGLRGWMTLGASRIYYIILKLKYQYREAILPLWYNRTNV